MDLGHGRTESFYLRILFQKLHSARRQRHGDAWEAGGTSGDVVSNTRFDVCQHTGRNNHQLQARDLVVDVLVSSLQVMIQCFELHESLFQVLDLIFQKRMLHAGLELWSEPGRSGSAATSSPFCVRHI